MGIYYNDLSSGFPLTTEAFNARLGTIDLALQDRVWGFLPWEQLNWGTPGALTIVNDAITITKSSHSIDTEGAASSDELSTISGGSVGDILTLTSTSSARVITLKHDVDNLYFTQEKDLVLDDPKKPVRLLFNGHVWMDVGWGGGPGTAKRIIVPRTTVGADVKNIVVASSIPQIYNHLKLILELSEDTNPAAWIGLNGDFTNGHYRETEAETHYDASPINYLVVNDYNTGSGTAGVAIESSTYITIPEDRTAIEFDIFNYTLATRAKAFYGKAYYPNNNTSGFIYMVRWIGFWLNTTDAVTSIQLDTNNGAVKFKAGSAYTLYGVY